MEEIRIKNKITMKNNNNNNGDLLIALDIRIRAKRGTRMQLKRKNGERKEIFAVNYVT